jgi:Immunity protein 30
MTRDTFDHAMASFEEAAVHFASESPEAIDAALATVMRHDDERCIGPLLLSLSDGAEQDEGMFSIIHAAEHFDSNAYVAGLVAVLPQLCANTPRWASIVMMRCLNDTEAKDFLVRALRDSSSEIKEAAIWLCTKINERNPAFLSKTVPILLAAQQ